MVTMSTKPFTTRDYPTQTIAQLKRYAYSIMLGLSIFSMTTVLLFGSPSFDVAPKTKTFNFYVYPVVIAVLAGLIWALLRGRISVEKFEKPLILLGTAFVIVKFSLTVLSAPETVPLAQIESWYWMLAGLWGFTHLTFTFYPALFINLGVYACIAGVPVVDVLLRFDNPALVHDGLSNLAASNFRFAGTFIVVTILGFIKHQWQTVEKEAMLLRSMALEDALTGLPNRRLLSSTLQQHIGDSKQKLSVILFDLDGFKKVNDRFGHNAGDEVLRQIGELACEFVRSSDMVGRWGGEEFLIICPGTKLEDGVNLAERLRQMLATRPMQHGQTITGSFGVAELRPGETAEQLINRADEALYAAKGRGKNQVWTSSAAGKTDASDLIGTG